MLTADKNKRDWFSVEQSDSDGDSKYSDAEEEITESKGRSHLAKRSRQQENSLLTNAINEEERGLVSSVKGVRDRKTDQSWLAERLRDSGMEEHDDDHAGSDFADVTDISNLNSDDSIVANKFVGKLNADDLESNRLKVAKSGVVYLSRIPPFMKPAKVRQILLRFGELGRVFLSPEDPKIYARRVRSGGNKKRSFIEGWVEFESKMQAKLAASTLNGNIIGKHNI